MLDISSHYLARVFNLELIGPSITLDIIRPVDNLLEKSLSFFLSSNKAFLRNTTIPYGCCFITDLMAAELSSIVKHRPDLCFLNCASPRLIFAKVISLYKDEIYSALPEPFIHSLASVHSSSHIGKGCNIGEGVSIGPNNVFDQSVIIRPGCVIESNNTFGIWGSTVIRDPDSSDLFMMPHIGQLLISEHNTFGANNTIARGTIGDTKIGKSNVISHQVNIAHNSVIGDKNLILAGAILCGGSIIGDNCWIAPGTVLKQKVCIGSNSVTDLNCTIHTNLDVNSVTIGPRGLTLKQASKLRHLLK